MFWKRAQILVAETWAALYPAPISTGTRIHPPHPLLPQGINQLTMFADHRVPQILHHLRILDYPPTLSTLKTQTVLPHGSRDEISIRSASILAVEYIKEEILKIRGKEADRDEVNSVIIDFYLWGLAKRIEDGDENIKGMQTVTVMPAHRTRSVWY